MYFHEEVLASLQKHGNPTARVDAQYPLGTATYVGGMVDSAVEVGAVHLDFPGQGELPNRIIGGLLYGVDPPVAVDAPLRFHCIESKRGHAAVAQAVGIAMAHEVATMLPLKGRNNAMMGALYYADHEECPTIQLFFSETPKANHASVDALTARGITAALMNTVGLSLVKRTGARAAAYFLSLGGSTMIQTIQRHRLERGMTAQDIKYP
jgi:hypothetical protein